MHDFHQEVIFKQYFYLHQQLQFMFLFADCFSLCLIFFCVCLDYSRSNEQIFIKNWWIGPGQRKNLLKEGSGSEFSEVPFQCIFNDFGFLLDISMKINLHVWFYFIVFLTILSVT